jgi:hypothetical protein
MLEEVPGSAEIASFSMLHAGSPFFRELPLQAHLIAVNTAALLIITAKSGHPKIVRDSKISSG